MTAPVEPWHRLTAAAREAVRDRALGELAAGRPLVTVAAAHALSTTLLESWWQETRRSLRRQLAAHHRPSRPSRPERLGAGEQQDLREAVLHHSPCSLALGSTLWNRTALIELTAHMHHVTLTEAAAGTRLREWGYAPKLPHRHPRLAAWRRETYPSVRAAAAADHALLLYVSHHTAPLHPCRPRELAPDVPVTVLNAYAPGGNRWFMLSAKKASLPLLLDFLERLAFQETRKMHLVTPFQDPASSKRWNTWLVRRRHRFTFHSHRAGQRP